MKTLLRVDASSRVDGSHSRDIADFFVEHWLNANLEGRVVTRDLVEEPIPHISEETITGYYTPKEQHTPELKAATALSDKLITELKEADIVLIDTPMYNFSVPSALKAWIDQVSRVGETFSFSPDTGFEGLVTGKPVYVITATGAVFSDEAMQPMDFLTPYLQLLLGFLGFAQVEVFEIEGTSTDEAAVELSSDKVKARIIALGLDYA